MTPFGTSFISKTKTSVEFRWTDPNNTPLGWDIEIVKKGNPVTGMPYNQTPIPQKQITVSGLEPSTFYEIYIRTQCTIDQKSAWNGPFVFSTVLENPTACGIALEVKDNGTETFLVDIDESGILGQDVFIESVELIVEHEWPADLMISLTNPAGKSIKLTRFHGSGSKNLGNPNDELCFQSTKFSDQACDLFQESQPPFNGIFKPAEPLHGLHDLSESSGNWKLIFQDRAAFHRGKLQYVKINLSTENCLLPNNFFIGEINNNSIVVNWESVPYCQSIKITIKEVNKPADQERVYFLNCNDETFRIPDLNPETEYEIFYQSVCGTNLSTSSCIQFFKTTCKPTTLSEFFDNETPCLPSCQFSCPLQGFWQNDDENIQNWTVWEKETDTENTGPSSDLSGEGKYIYIESQPNLCGIRPVILISSCILVESNGDGCDAAFHYHMSGSGIGSLTLEVSRDGGISWQLLWSKSGNQGNQWQRALISLHDYAGEIVLFRFVALPTQSIFGDIALDVIEFYGSRLMSNQFIYYRDLDGDGFGNEIDSIQVCRSTPPQGYVLARGDCQDNDANINPGAQEITCNLIDENCNGMADDRDVNSILTYQYDVVHESCAGQKNGRIEMTISGGQPPYMLMWNTGDQSATLNGLEGGVYVCTITDASGCSILSDFISVISQEQLQILVINTIKPTCTGLSDGGIFINHSGGQAPHNYLWSNGSITQNLLAIPEGDYQLTVTDINGCQAISPTYTLVSNPGIIAGPLQIKHPTCHESENGEIELGVISGIPPFDYKWQNGVTQASLKQVGSGTYSCTVSDSRGCKNTVQVELSSPDSLKTVVLNIEPVRCNGEKNGIIKTTTSGGTSPYLYFWSNGLFQDDIFDLGPGLYSLTVTDRNGCNSVLENIEVTQPLPLRSTIAEITSARCILGKNGKIELASTGGTPPYHYSWSEETAPDSSALEHVQFGIYSVIIFDDLGCKFSLGSILLPYVNINLPVDMEVTRFNKCAEDMSGTIIATVETGSSPYDFNWSQGFQHVINTKSDTLGGLISGNYSVTVTDSEGCVGTSVVKEIPEIPALNFKVIELMQNICKDDSNGKIQIQINNAQGPADVFWSTGTSGFILDNLPNGEYSAEVLDSAGCLLSIPLLEITSRSNLQLDTFIQHSEMGKSNGKACILVEGSAGIYDILWDANITEISGNCAENLSPGTYEVTVTDAEQCQEIIAFSIRSIVETIEPYSEILKFYPNPTGEILFCNAELQNISFEIKDMQGNILFHKPSGFSCSDIPISQFTPGLYLIYFIYNKRPFHLKLVKI